MPAGGSALRTADPAVNAAATNALGRRGWVLVLAVIAAEALVLGVIAARHGIDADEGFYWAAGRAVREGRRLYADVFYPQMPYFPWLEALAFGLFGVSLATGRVLCVVAGALGAGIVAALVWRAEHSVATTIGVALLYLASGVLLTNLAITKTYAVANLGLLWAFAVLISGPAPTPMWAFLAGAATAWAIGVRLAVVPVGVLYLALAGRGGLRSLVAFAAGGVIGSLPWIWTAWSHPDQFWFCNVTFHQLRREITTPSAIIHQKLGVLRKWLLVPQHILLWGLAGVGFWLAPRRVWPAATVATLLAAAYLMATPTYLMYTAQFIPFVVLTATPAIALLSRRPAIAAAVLAAYVVAVYPLIRSVPASSSLSAKRALWDRRTVTAVSTFIQTHTPADEPILSWWEGYPVLTGRPTVIGVGFWESNVARKVSPDAAARYHVRQRDDIRAVIQRREPSAIIVPDGTWKDFGDAMAQAGYRPAHREGAIEIYLRGTAADAAREQENAAGRSDTSGNRLTLMMRSGLSGDAAQCRRDGASCLDDHALQPGLIAAGLNVGQPGSTEMARRPAGAAG